MDKLEIENPQVPLRHNLDQPALPKQFGLDDWRQFSDPSPGKQRDNQSSVLVNREVRLERYRIFFLSVCMSEGPGILRGPEREGEQAVVKQVRRAPGDLCPFQVRRARNELVPVGQEPPND